MSISAEMGHRDNALANAKHYFTALAAGNLEEAVTCFTEDIVYSHPAYAGEEGAARHEVRGRAALLELFRQRPTVDVRHHIIGCVVSDDRCYLEGTFTVDGDRISGSFVSTARIDDQGRFAHYVAYSSIPAAAAPS